MPEDGTPIPLVEPDAGESESKGDEKREPEAAKIAAPGDGDTGSGLLQSTAKESARPPDLDHPLKAVSDAASGAAQAWLSYLAVLLYLFVAAAAVTHVELFFERPVKLPFLNVELPLIGFAWFAPAILMVVHVYALLNLVILGGKVREFGRALAALDLSPDSAAAEQKRLPVNFFVQWLAGPPGVRGGVVGILLHMIAWITMIGAPVALLVFFQLQFLPYHSAPITWWHRIAVLLDTGLIWALWSGVAGPMFVGISRRFWRVALIAGVGALSLLPILFVFFVFTFPGERMEEHLTTVGSIRPLHDALLGGGVDPVSRRPNAIFSNRLVLPDIDVIDHQRFDTEAKIDSLDVSVSLRGRDLRNAVLYRAKLRSVDFSGANLRGADLIAADLRRAKLGCVPPGYCTTLDEALLDSADLRRSELSGTSLRWAHLSWAQLQGAQLEAAKLQGADLDRAHLEGASMSSAALSFANLDYADLRVADLSGTDFFCTSLKSARLGGAVMRGTSLQGANLQEASFQAALLDKPAVWHAVGISGGKSADWNGALVKAPQTGSQIWDAQTIDTSSAKSRDFTKSLQYLKGAALIGVEASHWRTVEDKLKQLGPLASPSSGEDTAAKVWEELAKRRPDRFGDHLLTLWTRTACEERNAPYVLEGIIERMYHVALERFSTDLGLSASALARLASVALDRERCPAAKKLTEADEAALRAFLIDMREPLPVAGKN
jgi:uncharacterized protein YjbI with pentapeptide repeats